jgi:ATP-dependent DNA helicase RecG
LGIRNINKYLPFYSNGVKPIFREDRQRFKLEIPLVNTESRAESKLALEILELLKEGTKSKSELAQLLGHISISGELKKQLIILQKQQLIVMTIPDKPNSRLQKYSLTD